jgi:hypothetical protein
MNIPVNMKEYTLPELPHLFYRDLFIFDSPFFLIYGIDLKM